MVFLCNRSAGPGARAPRHGGLPAPSSSSKAQDLRPFASAVPGPTTAAAVPTRLWWFVLRPTGREGGAVPLKLRVVPYKGIDD